MRRAGHKRPISARAVPATPCVGPPNVVAFAAAEISDTAVDLELLPSVKATSTINPHVTDDCEARHQALAIAIHQRIESRLLGRVRNLRVRSFDGTVILEGQCATYYTKQLAQHTAMGILEDEHLENSIVVSVQ
jgi:osmotically-inducible protein OsmY